MEHIPACDLLALVIIFVCLRLADTRNKNDRCNIVLCVRRYGNSRHGENHNHAKNYGNDLL